MTITLTELQRIVSVKIIREIKEARSVDILQEIRVKNKGTILGDLGTVQ